jgi:FkbM family methyltransferase
MKILLRGYYWIKKLLNQNKMRYSQNQEEDVIKSFFGDRTGTFLDIGANDGKELSNTYALVERGWAGTYVEASPVTFNKLVENIGDNPKFDFINCAAGSKDGKIVLHESGKLPGLGTENYSLVSSTREDEVHRWDSLEIPFKDVTVKELKFDSILKLTKHKTFDLISVDIEGMEPEVIPQINFEKLGCKMAIIEWNMNRGEFYDSIMLEHGMACMHVNAENRIYVLIGKDNI